VSALVIELVRGVGVAAVAALVFGALFVLPGMRLADRLAGDARAFVPRLILALVCSQVIVVAIGIVLVALGWFSGAAVAVVALAFAIAGLPVALRWLQPLRGAPLRLGTTGWAVALALPWVLIVGRAGWPPADTLQWYYADLGTQLARAGGIPVSVAEWGRSVRWLPDYLVFNVDSEAFLAVLGLVPRGDALAAWRVPVTLLGILVMFAVVRLWVGRPAALAGTALIAGSAFYLAKFDAYKPEALGAVLGLAALWLVVRGLRSRRASWVLLGGACLGIDLSVHAIAAMVIGLLVVGFGAAEWLASRDRQMARAGWLVQAALLGILVSVVMGVGLQGRPVVAGGALNPGSALGADPTWTFFLRSTGDFTIPEPKPPALPLAGGVTNPWAGFRITSAFGWWLIPFAGIGALAFAALGGRRARSGVIGLAGSTVLVGAGIAFFALVFDTYVPRWTGLVRFGQYLPLLAGLGVTFAIAGYLRLWAWLAEVRVPRAFALVAAIAGIVWLVPWAATRYAAEPAIAPDGRAALEALRSMGSRGDVVLSNALTTGTIESFTGLEAPLEGRQPLIEDPAFLAATNQLLLDAHQWFAAPSDRRFLDRLGVRWLLVLDDPATLGAPATLGGTASRVEIVDGLRIAWSGPGIALLEVRDAVTAAAVTDGLRPVVDVPRAALVGVLGIIAGAIVVVPVAWIRRRRESRQTD
jgi:hypothetical protein